MTGEGAGTTPTAETSRAPRAHGSPRRRPPWWVWLVGVVVVAAGVLVAVAVVNGSAPRDPADAAPALCRSAIEERLERRGASDIEVTRAMRVTPAPGTGFRVEGSVTYAEDGDALRAQVRCVVRVDDDGGGAVVASVRFRG